MKTAEQILEENKSRMANVVTLGGAHARLAGLFFHLAVYNILVELENCGRKKLRLSVFFETDEEKELINAILDNYNMQFMKVEKKYMDAVKTHVVTISCKY